MRSDSTILLRGPKRSGLYPDSLRRVSYHALDIDKRFVFLANNFTLPALTIARRYRCRRRVELFFQWIKQNPRVKAFYRTSDNAVKTQIWIAIGAYALVAIVKKELAIKRGAAAISQILSVSLFEKKPILRACWQDKSVMEHVLNHKQLPLFN